MWAKGDGSELYFANEILRYSYMNHIYSALPIKMLSLSC